MMYGNNSNGYGYSPDRRNDRVNHDNLSSTFIGASGNRVTGYYSSGYGSSGYGSNRSGSTGYYDGRGVFHRW